MSGLDFPVALRLEGRRVLMVGGGKVATGRVKQLVEVGADVRVIASDASAELVELARAGAIRLERREFRRGDVANAMVVFTATDDRALNAQVVAEARDAGILANAADEPELCDFHMPSVGRRGPIAIAVSTSGYSPGVARALKTLLLAEVGPEWAALAKLVGRLRRLRPSGPDRMRALAQLAAPQSALLLARGQRDQLWNRVRHTFAQLDAALAAHAGDHS